jgi:hypothetical protein
LPQGLKPVIREAACGTAEAVPFPKPKPKMSYLTELKPIDSSAACGTAEAMPFPKTIYYIKDQLPHQ